MGNARTDLSGRRFWRLIVQRFDHRKPYSGGFTQMWLCLCDCGTEKVVAGQSLVKGASVARLRGLEAETPAEEAEFANVWHRLWKEVQPYLEGRVAYSDEQREAA